MHLKLMKVTFDNIKKIDYFIRNCEEEYDYETGQLMLKSILTDLNELNELLINHNQSYKQLYLDWQDYHNEYSPERTDPCPDYYGLFTLRFEKNPYETVGDEMTIHEIENALFVLINFEEFLSN